MVIEIYIPDEIIQEMKTGIDFPDNLVNDALKTMCLTKISEEYRLFPEIVDGLKELFPSENADKHFKTIINLVNIEKDGNNGN